MAQPRISIVTPSYNHGEFLEDTLQSVFRQQYENLEYIVVDGGSTDSTQSILEHYAPRLAYVVSEPDQGQTDALIKGFSKATGDILAWINSDDMYQPAVLQEVAEIFASNPSIKCIYGDTMWLDRNGRFMSLKREIPFHRFIWSYDHNYIPQPSTFWRRSLYEDVSGLDPTFNLAMDADLFIRFADRTKLHHVPRMWSSMRSYPEQKNKALRAQSDLEDERIRQRYGISMHGFEWEMKHAVARWLRVALKLKYYGFRG